MHKSDFPAAQFGRRRLLLASGLAAGYVGLGVSSAAERPPTPLETANLGLVTRFCLEWAARDVEKLVPYLADSLVYQMFEGRPDIVGVDAFRREIGPFLTDLARVEWEILGSFAIGQIVINERIDHFIARPGKRSMHFPIAGLFVVTNGRIALWRDYRLPDGKPRMEIEPVG